MDDMQQASRTLVSAHLVVEVVKEMEDAILIIRVMIVHILEQLDFVQTLVKVVLIILHQTCCSHTQCQPHIKLPCG